MVYAAKLISDYELLNFNHISALTFLLLVLFTRGHCIRSVLLYQIKY